jgi:hypothetical protein
MSLLQYLRSFRIFEIALFDLIASIIGLYYILRFIQPNQSNEFYWSWVAVLVLPLSVISHLLTDTPTMLNYYLGLSPPPIRNVVV